MKIRKVLNDRQMLKAKIIYGMGALFCAGYFIKEGVVQASEKFSYNSDHTFKSYGNVTMSKGVIHYYGYNDELCNR